MGAPVVPSESELVATFALARALVAAVENDERWPEPLDRASCQLDREPAIFGLAQLVVLLAGGIAPLASAIETMSTRPPSRGRCVAACAVNREWFRATEDNSAEAMRLIAKLARKEPS